MPLFLRRNKNKYYPWNFIKQTNYHINDNPQNYGIKNYSTDDISNNNKKYKVVRNQLDTFSDPNLQLKYTNSEQLSNTPSVDSNYNTKKKQYNVQKIQNSYNETTPLNSNTNSFTGPKKVIIKNDKKDIPKEFKDNRKFDIEKSNIDPETTNQSGYNESRLFKNENLQRNQLYFYNYNSNLQSKAYLNKNLVNNQESVNK